MTHVMGSVQWTVCGGQRAVRRRSTMDWLSAHGPRLTAHGGDQDE